MTAASAPEFSTQDLSNMFESTGEIIDVKTFSDTDDLVTIRIKIPPPLGEEKETHTHDRVLPKGTVKVGDIIDIVIRPPR